LPGFKEEEARNDLTVKEAVGQHQPEEQLFSNREGKERPNRKILGQEGAEKRKKLVSG